MISNSASPPAPRITSSWSTTVLPTTMRLSSSALFSGTWRRPRRSAPCSAAARRRRRAVQAGDDHVLGEVGAVRVQVLGVVGVQLRLGDDSSAHRSISPNTMSSEPSIADDVGQHVAPAHEVHRLQMREARRADLAAIRLVGAVGHQIDAELALGRFDRGIDLAGRARGSPRCRA